MDESDRRAGEIDRAIRRLLLAARRLTSSAFDEQSRRHLRPIAEWSAMAFEAASLESTSKRIALALARPELVDLELPSPVKGLVVELELARCSGLEPTRSRSCHAREASHDAAPQRGA
jgi:hypothetical protein